MPWVKIYTEILDDPKMMDLSTSAKWRFVQFIALAGEFDMNGLLTDGDNPMSVKKIAWRLREAAETIQGDLDQLKAAGLISESDGAICVVNFSARQGRPQSERQRQWRERKRAEREKDKTAPESDVTPTPVHPVTDVTRDATVTRRPRIEKNRVDKDKDKEIGAPTKKPAGETGAIAQAPKKVSTKNGPDPRSGHPAIAAIREITGRFPNRVLYDQLIGVLKESPNMDLARECYKSWLARGYNPNAVTAFTDWYAQGGPPAPPGKRMDAATERNSEVTVYKGEAEAARFEAEERAKNPDYDAIPF
jgi:hypothetical protein